MGQKINIFYMLKATKITVFGLVCVFCGYSANVYADYKFNGFRTINWGGYNWHCNSGDEKNPIIVGGPGIDGLDAYECTSSGWRASNSVGLCNWGGSYSDSGEVAPNTYGHVEESFYSKHSSTSKGEYGWTTHRLDHRDEEFMHQLIQNTRSGGKYCFFRGCADYAKYITKPQPRCKRKYPLYLRDGDKYIFCGDVHTVPKECGYLSSDECPCPEDYSQDGLAYHHGHGEKYTISNTDAAVHTWKCHITSAGSYWKPEGTYNNADLLALYQCAGESADSEEEVIETPGVVTPVGNGGTSPSAATDGRVGDTTRAAASVVGGGTTSNVQAPATTTGTEEQDVPVTESAIAGASIEATEEPDETGNNPTPGSSVDAVESITEPAAPSGQADGESCEKPGAEIAEYRGGKCVAMKCSPGFERDGDDCIEISGPCKSLPDNATRGHRQYDAETESEKCIVDDCVDGYVVADDKLSCHEDYDALAEQAREREQSTGNKLLGAVGMGATGIGGSMLLAGMSETKSDDEAERAMKAYLSTFTCKYGNESVPGGTMNVEIPGGNELIQMYAEYVALANDLKVRKEALGMKPGIESEAILDSATSGLYDDVSTGKTKGVYASLARALSDPNSEDAKIWAAQREESEEKKKTGAIVAGIGAIGSLLGDVAINKIDWKAKQKKVLRDLETDVSNITPRQIPCPSGATGTYAPNCVCKQSNQVYNVDMNRCDACPSGHVVVNGKCECPQDKHEVNGECVDITALKDAAEYLGNKMLGELEDKAVLPADNLFEYGSDVLTPEAKNALDDFIRQLDEAGATSCVPQVDGYADPSGKPEYNLDLSKRRAESVATYLKNNSSNLITVVKSEGYGEGSCTCGLSAKVTQTINWDDQDYRVCKDKEGDYSVSENNKSSRYAPCRRVEIKPGCVVGAPNHEGLLNAVAETLGS